jgi:hypothetical protein
MSCMSYYPCELGCRDRRRFQAGVLRVTGRRADGNSGVDPASPAVRASIGTASRRYTEGIAPREHEGTTVQRGGWRVRVAFAFDPKRKAILLVAGDKSGISEKKFYRDLIRKADERFDAHLFWLKKTRR